MNRVVIKGLLGILLLAVTGVVTAGSFDRYNITGVRNAFYQQDQWVFWDGGTFNILDQGTTRLHQPDVARFERYNVHYMKWTPVYSNGQSIIYMHGFQSHAGWFYESAEKLALLGYTVYAFDRIGSGKSSRGLTVIPMETSEPAQQLRGKGHINSWMSYTQTVHLMTRIAKAEHPGYSLNLWANSFGAHLLTAYVLEHAPEDIAALVYTSPGLFSKLPLPFSVDELIAAAPGTYFPSPIPERDGDQGAHLFTSDTRYLRAIAADRQSLRQLTKEFYFNVSAVQNYHFATSAMHPQDLTRYRRFYLVVDGDPMMDTARTVNYVQQFSENAVLKLYSGGADHRHFLAFTADAEIVLADIDQFLLAESVPGSEVLP